MPTYIQIGGRKLGLEVVGGPRRGDLFERTNDGIKHDKIREDIKNEYYL